jgi:hypothetical protein
VSRSLPNHPRSLIVSPRIDTLTPKGLADHAESVSCYLYEYGRNRDLRSEYSKSFFQYLLAASWMKLHSRLSSWQALGFIHALENAIIGNVIESKIENIGTLSLKDDCDGDIGPGDRTLGGFFLQNKDYLIARMQTACKELPELLQLSKLFKTTPSGSEDDKCLTLSVFADSVELALNKKKAFYTKETALTFHYLIYLSFIMAGRALRRIKDCYRDSNLGNVKSREKLSEKVVKTYKDEIIAAELPFRFLIYMLSSTVFRSHMRVWMEEGWSMLDILPIFKDKHVYLAFGKDRSILASSKQGPYAQAEDSQGPSPDTEDAAEDMAEVREPIC